MYRKSIVKIYINFPKHSIRTIYLGHFGSLVVFRFGLFSLFLFLFFLFFFLLLLLLLFCFFCFVVVVVVLFGVIFVGSVVDLLTSFYGLKNFIWCNKLQVLGDAGKNKRNSLHRTVFFFSIIIWILESVSGIPFPFLLHGYCICNFSFYFCSMDSFPYLT